ncbi:MAG: aminoacyl-histidine dipeptidase [Bacteroidaceae bacterium]|nr:aminoacyl-histidine dipeptidase [Prevotellaceae bacterium]MDY5632454.1 aminoacyl-histidine dipeptidase [Bacteroidaceae bacterium]
MEKTIKDLEPKAMWHNFYLLTQVPRPSGHLEKIQEFLLNWAKERGIEAWKDTAENIVMRKPATPGMEGRKTAVLQAHMDMVPQKTKESTHDFVNDPIETYIEDGWVKAKGTTLGSDDGIGVAAIMAVMESKDLKHGPLEALITADEESSMYGVMNLKADTLTGDILLNIDNETLGEFVIGSAGGVNINMSLGYKEQETEQGDAAFKISLKGLKGGHSGLEICVGRANANKLMARVVRQAIQDDDALLASWVGGNMRNAIPSSAEVVLTLPKENAEDLKDLVAYCQQVFQDEYRGIEEGISLSVEPTEMPKAVMPQEIQDNVVNAITACHDGVLRYIPSIPSVVETSSNLGIVNIQDGNVKILVLARSSNDTMMEYIQERHEACFSMAGMKVDFSGQYGAWQPNFDSPITAKMVEVYNKMYPDTPAKVEVCHAGLECSIICAVYPNMDPVSFGPTLRSPHTPNERCDIESVAKFWDFLRQVLEEIPAK